MVVELDMLEALPKPPLPPSMTMLGSGFMLSISFSTGMVAGAG